MNKEDLLKLLEIAADCTDTEIAHGMADDALITFINDDDITKAYDLVNKWYA